MENEHAEVAPVENTAPPLPVMPEPMPVPMSEPVVTPPQESAPAQTSAPQQPLQVENVSYNVQVGKMSSKVSLAMSILTGALFVLGLVAWGFFTALIDVITGQGTDGVSGVLVFTIAALAALIPTVYLAQKRLEASLTENPAAIEDILFKKKLRRFFMFYVVLSVLGLFLTVYTLLAAAFLHTATFNGFLNALAFFAIVGSLAWFFWGYQKRTTR